VTGQETFELAAAIAGVCIGLAALVIFSLVAIIGAWQVFRRASEASTAATKASQGAEELARHLAFQAAGPPRGESGQLTEVRQEAAALLDKLRELAESGALEGGPSVAALSQLEASVGRLDATVGQMAAGLANLVQLWEQQRR
jgi:type II secretory pathway component PulJ